MLEFTLENLKRVNRVVITHAVADTMNIGSETSRRLPLHLSLFVGQEQVQLGFRRRDRHFGAFTVDASGRRLALMFIEEITGSKFELTAPDKGPKKEEYRRPAPRLPTEHDKSKMKRISSKRKKART